jgi:hypothetical protein
VHLQLLRLFLISASTHQFLYNTLPLECCSRNLCSTNTHGYFHIILRTWGGLTEWRFYPPDWPLSRLPTLALREELPTRKIPNLYHGHMPAHRRRRYVAVTAQLMETFTNYSSQLAHAGFFFKPSTSSPDNTVCFLCGKYLDGWEEDDDPVQEHLKHSPDCGWAIMTSLERLRGEDRVAEDPTGLRMVEARRSTFASIWPHEGKRGWTCKVEKVNFSTKQSASSR